VGDFAFNSISWGCLGFGHVLVCFEVLKVTGFKQKFVKYLHFLDMFSDAIFNPIIIANGL